MRSAAVPVFAFASAVLLAAAAFAAEPAAPAVTPPPLSDTVRHPDRPSGAAVLAANTVSKLNVPYGGPDAKLDVLDIYAPKDAHGAPVLVYIHGGEWSRGDKFDVAYKPKFLNEHGIILVAPNYRLSPAAVHPAQVDDVATALAWVHAHIAEYGGDPDKVVLLGHSAGCHLVTYVGLNAEPLRKVGLTPKSAMRGIVAWSGGMYDLVARHAGGGMYKPFIEATFGESEAAQRAGSPLTYIDHAADAPPFLICSADGDHAASRDASRELANAINAHGGKATADTFQDRTHFTADHDLGEPDDTTGKALLTFIDSVTR